jgi:hypothetical protein
MSIKTIGLTLNEKLILEAGGLESLIQRIEGSPDTVRFEKGKGLVFPKGYVLPQILLEVSDKTTKAITDRLKSLENFIDKQYYSSCHNRILYWLNWGKIGSCCNLSHDLKVVLKNIQDPHRHTNQEKDPRKLLAAELKEEFRKVNEYRFGYGA